MVARHGELNGKPERRPAEDVVELWNQCSLGRDYVILLIPYFFIFKINKLYCIPTAASIPRLHATFYRKVGLISTKPSLGAVNHPLHMLPAPALPIIGTQREHKTMPSRL